MWRRLPAPLGGPGSFDQPRIADDIRDYHFNGPAHLFFSPGWL